GVDRDLGELHAAGAAGRRLFIRPVVFVAPPGAAGDVLGLHLRRGGAEADGLVFAAAGENLSALHHHVGRGVGADLAVNLFRELLLRLPRRLAGRRGDRAGRHAPARRRAGRVVGGADLDGDV